MLNPLHVASPTGWNVYVARPSEGSVARDVLKYEKFVLPPLMSWGGEGGGGVKIGPGRAQGQARKK